mgnify:CR=1 FL=1
MNYEEDVESDTAELTVQSQIDLEMAMRQEWEHEVYFNLIRWGPWGPSAGH